MFLKFQSIMDLERQPLLKNEKNCSQNNMRLEDDEGKLNFLEIANKIQ